MAIVIFTFSFTMGDNADASPRADVTVTLPGVTLPPVTIHDIITIKPPTITLPPVTVPPITKYVPGQGPTHTVTVHEPGPTKTVRVGTPRATKTVTVRPHPRAPVPGQNHTKFIPRTKHSAPAEPQPKDKKPNPIDFGDGKITITEVGIGVITTIIIAGLLLLAMYGGYILGYKDSDKANAKFLSSLRDQIRGKS